MHPERLTEVADVAEPSVASAMIHRPKVWAPEVTVATVRGAFEDDHLHAALVVDGRTLLAVVARDDLAISPDTDPAWRCGRLHGRTVGPHADLSHVRRQMVRRRWRRLAVVDHQATLLGLLCLKRSGHGFCSDADVATRADERLGRATASF